MKIAMGLAALAACAGSAFAGASIDGSRDASYQLLGVQQAPTQFGDSNLGVVDWANGSELDGVYYAVNGDRLNLFFSGNLESNFNKFELFIDYRSGGQNQLRGDNADVDFNGLNRMAGMTFDSGFEPDLYFTMSGGDNGGSYKRFANYAELLTGGAGGGGYLGDGGAGVGGLAGGGANPFGFDLSINNSNVGGLPGDPALVATGVEVSLSLSAMGISDAFGLRLAAFINGSSHDFVSNQVLGSLPSDYGNLGEPSQINFNDHAGAQYVTIIPTPGMTAFAGLGVLVAARRRRA